MNTLLLRNCMKLPALLAMLACSTALYAQDVEPRRWSHLPTDTNVVGLATSYSTGDIYFDPLLELQDVETEIYGAGFVYMRTFGLAEKTARVDFLAPWAMGRWSGLLSGEPASTRRHGFSDPRIRFSMLVYGAPALNMQEFVSQPRSNTVVGIAVSVKPPLGEYYGERLINLGTNRWMVRPQLGVTHKRDKWTWELTGSFFWYSENDDFFGGKKLETDELWALQGHAIYTFRPGLWLSVSTAYGSGADTLLNGVDQNLKVDNWLMALSLGVPINRRQGLKFAWVRTRTQRNTGADMDSFNLGWTLMF